MKPFIPKEKAGKKARRKLDAQGRATWGELKPVTKTVPSKKHYSRKRARREEELHFGPFAAHMRCCV